MCCGLLYNLIMVTIRLYSYDVLLTVRLQTESQLVFPAVTICNMNAIKSSMWSKYKQGLLAKHSFDEKPRKKRSKRASPVRRSRKSKRAVGEYRCCYCVELHGIMLRHCSTCSIQQDCLKRPRFIILCLKNYFS